MSAGVRTRLRVVSINFCMLLTNRHGLKRGSMNQSGLKKCFIWISPRFSSAGRVESSSISMILTENPAPASTVASRITRTSVRATPRTCMHIFTSDCIVPASFVTKVSVNAFIKEISPLLSGIYCYSCESKEFPAAAGMRHKEQEHKERYSRSHMFPAPGLKNHCQHRSQYQSPMQ